MDRKLTRAAVYREFIFRDAAALAKYLDGGHFGRWLVSTKEHPDGILAIVGENYNNTQRLKMIEREERK